MKVNKKKIIMLFLIQQFVDLVYEGLNNNFVKDVLNYPRKRRTRKKWFPF